MSMSEIMEFKSRVGVFSKMLPVAISILLIVLAIRSWNQTGMFILYILSLILSWVVFHMVVEKTVYILDGSALVVKFLGMTVRIEYASVARITDTDDFFSMHFGLSGDSVGIHYEGGYLTVSPEDKDGFIAQLRSRCPQATFDRQRMRHGKL